MRAPRFSDRFVPQFVVGLATAAVAVTWVLPALAGNLEFRCDAAGHLLAAQTLRDRFFPAAVGWDGQVFAGWPQGELYPPLTHWLIAALGRVIPIETAFRAVVAAAALLLPAAAFRFARARRLPPGRSAAAALLVTASAFGTPATFGVETELGGTFHGDFAVGLVSNATAMTLFFLAGAALPAALGARRRLAPAAILLAAAVCNHLVGGVAVALLFVAETAARATGSARPSAVLRRAVATIAVAMLLAAWWWAPMLVDGRLGRISHLPAASGPLPTVAAAAALFAAALATDSRRRTRVRTAGVAAFTAAVFVLMQAADAWRLPIHGYRFAMFAMTGACVAIAGAAAGRRTVTACALVAAAWLAAFATHGPPEGLKQEAPAVCVPPGVDADCRVLAATAADHDFSSHYLETEFARRSGAGALVGLFVESSPLSRWTLDLARTVVFDTYSWGVPLDVGSAARLAMAATEAPFVGAQTDSRAAAFLRRRLADFGVTHVLSDRRPQAELTVEGAVAPVVMRTERRPGLQAAGGFEVEDGSRVFRLYALKEPGKFAEPLRDAVAATSDADEDAWDLAVERWMFDDAGAESRPIAARPGLDVRSAPPCDVRALRRDGGSTIDLTIDAVEPVPVVVKTSWHPAWRAYDGGGSAIPVDRAAPGFCVVRACGDVRMRFERRLFERVADLASALGVLTALGAFLLRRKLSALL